MVSQRCQVAGKPRAVAERSLAEFDGCLLWRKIFRQSQILQNIHKKCQRLRKHGVYFFFPPWMYSSNTAFFFAAPGVSSPIFRHPHPDEVGPHRESRDFFGAGSWLRFGVEKLQSEMSNHGVRVCSTSC